MTLINNISTINSTFVPLVPYFPEGAKLYKLTLKAEVFFNLNIFPVIFGIGSFWNLLIIIYFVKINLKSLKKTSSYHFLIIKLAVVDLCTSVGVSITFHFNAKPTWELGTFGCILMKNFVDGVCPMVSCWLLVLISFARFRSVLYPLRERINKKKYSLVCLFIWILAFLLNVYAFMTINEMEIQGATRCYSDAPYEKMITFMFLKYFLDSFIPFAIMLVLYYKMKKRLNAEENENSFALNNQSRQRNRRALRIIRGLLFLFAITMILGRVLMILSWALAFFESNYFPLFWTFHYVFIQMLSPLLSLNFFMNNILNIFIYAKMIPGFRSFLLTVVTFGMYGKRNVRN